MQISELQNFINIHLRKKNGDLSPMKKEQWWVENNFVHVKDQLFQLTAFLENPIWPQRIWHIENNVFEPVKCLNPACGKLSRWNTHTSKYVRNCNIQCSSVSTEKLQKFKDTCLERFGTTAPALSSKVQAKRRELSLERHGVDHPGKTDKVKATIKAAFVEKYGVDNPAKDAAVKKKTKATNQDKYGVDYPLQSATVLAKRTATNIDRYGVASPTQVKEIQQKQRDTLFANHGVTNPRHIGIPQDLIDTLNDKPAFISLVEGKFIQDVVTETALDKTTLYKYIQRYDCYDSLKKDYSRSSLERDFESFLSENNIKYEASNRSILSPKELDFYLPDHNLAVELCGVYYHGENFGRGKEYHYNKWVQCYEKGITLLTYFDDELSASYSIIKSKILYLTGKGSFTKVGARQLKLKSIPVGEEREFFERNHLQGFLNNRNFSIGAYYGDKLLAVMCITNRKNYCEITRFAVDIDYTIPGVFSKLLTHYVKTTGYKGTIISFSDNCHSNGNLYRAAGFELVEIMGASYYYSRGGAPRENRQAYMKSKIEKKFGISTNGKTEEAIMREMQYNKVWDCGKIKWKLIV